MAKKQDTNDRLSRNFHKTFKPERHYINAMMRFAASGKTGDYQTIASSTGIPMGESTGKVPAVLDYCRAMGLVRLMKGSERSSDKRPELTNFGRVVLLEDPFFKCDISQWLAHFHMCSPVAGADVWYHTFFSGAPMLGWSFSRDQLEAYLCLIYGVRKGGLIGPLVGMYEDDASFKICGALNESNGLIIRKSAPVSDEFARGYGAWFLQMISDHFPKQRQVSIVDLEKVAGWKSIPGWSGSSIIAVLELLERKSLVTVDRHMEPWLVEPKLSTENAWRDIFLDMI